MQDFSLIDKFKILTKVIISSPFYISLTTMIIIFLSLFLLSMLYNKKISKKIYVSIWIGFVFLVLIYYYDFLLQLVDNLFDTIFQALYFPNLSFYVITLLISNFFFIYSIFNKKIKTAYKVINIVNTVIIDLLFIFIVGVTSTNNINVYDEINVFTNSSLLVLLELNSAFFVSWLLLNLFISYYFKAKKYDDNVSIKIIDTPEIIFDWNRN